jgi:hypothetical protein
MTSAELKRHVEEAGRSPHFFDRETMRHFGDTMSNYGVRGPCEVDTATRKAVRVYELYRRRPVKHGLTKSAYFDAATFARVHPAM